MNTVHKLDRDGVCSGCGKPSQDYWGMASISRITRWGGNVSNLKPLCEYCFEVDCAMVEAVDDQRRFTQIGVGPAHSGALFYNGSRCYCGAVSLPFMKIGGGNCVRCAKDKRMLTQLEANNKFISKLMIELRAEIRTQKKFLTERE